MGEQFRVDLDELDSVVRKLKQLRGDMDKPSQKMKYSTAIPKSAFGSSFNEAESISASHDKMQEYMSQVITALHKLITEFGDKTERSRGAYEDQEQETKASMRQSG
ncbi:hypothetical protein [Streptomyces sp. NPDC015125]|uniref:hypothetical protein n=1 Tax=Streptomyces sp. NPDC015125 TaxID=3364938 RepID=UPI0037018ADF